MPTRLPARRLLRSAAWTPVVLTIVAAIHVAVVSSILVEDRSVIWPMHNDTIHRLGRGADFYSVYHAGTNASRSISPYENNDDGVTPYYYPFRYLPIVAMAAQGFTYLTPVAAYYVWVLLLEGLLVLLLIVLWRAIHDRLYRLATVALLLVSSPYFLELHMGQFTFASVAMCCLALILPAGPFLFTASVLLKPISLAVVPALARERRFLPTYMLAIACLLLVSVPYFIRYPAQWSAFFQSNFQLRGGFHAGNYGFVYFLSLLAVDSHVGPLLQHWSGLTGMLRLLVLVSTALLVFHSRKSSVRVSVSALLLAHFLTYQHVWEHHMSGVCVLGALLMTVPNERRLRYAAVLSCLFLLALPTPFGLMDSAKDPSIWDPSRQWPRYASYVTVLSKVVPTAVLYLVAMVDAARGGFMSPREAIRSALSKASRQRF